MALPSSGAISIEDIHNEAHQGGYYGTAHDLRELSAWTGWKDKPNLDQVVPDGFDEFYSASADPVLIQVGSTKDFNGRGNSAISIAGCSLDSGIGVLVWWEVGVGTFLRTYDYTASNSFTFRGAEFTSSLSGTSGAAPVNKLVRISTNIFLHYYFKNESGADESYLKLYTLDGSGNITEVASLSVTRGFSATDRDNCSLVYQGFGGSGDLYHYVLLSIDAMDAGTDSHNLILVLQPTSGSPSMSNYVQDTTYSFETTNFADVIDSTRWLYCGFYDVGSGNDSIRFRQIIRGGTTSAPTLPAPAGDEWQEESLGEYIPGHFGGIFDMRIVTTNKAVVAFSDPASDVYLALALFTVNADSASVDAVTWEDNWFLPESDTEYEDSFSRCRLTPLNSGYFVLSYYNDTDDLLNSRLFKVASDELIQIGPYYTVNTDVYLEYYDVFKKAGQTNSTERLIYASAFLNDYGELKMTKVSSMLTSL